MFDIQAAHTHTRIHTHTRQLGEIDFVIWMDGALFNRAKSSHSRAHTCAEWTYLITLITCLDQTLR